MVQCALVGDGGLPGTLSDAVQWKFLPRGIPTEYRTWFAGPRHATSTTFLWSGKNTAGAENVVVHLMLAGRVAGLVKAMVPLAFVSPWEYQTLLSPRPAQAMRTALRPSGSIY